MNPFHENGLLQTRRELIFNTAKCLGGAALGSLMAPNLISAPRTSNGIGGLAGLPHFAPKAKRVIMLFFSGGPSHIDMFDYKPRMRDFHGTELARLHPQRPTHYRDDQWPKIVPLRRTNVQIQTPRRARHLGE